MEDAVWGGNGEEVAFVLKVGIALNFSALVYPVLCWRKK